MSKNAADQIGKKFGKLKIIGVDSKSSEKQQVHRKYECECECGNKLFASLNELKNGHITMCLECSKKCGKFFYSGNIKNHPLYRRARGIYERCNFKNNHEYHNYGGRGIKCELGDTISDVVRSLEKVPGFFDNAQIDRIDNNGNYTLEHPIYGDKVWYDDQGRSCLGNLRWVTSKDNANNTRCTVELDDLRNFPRRMEKIKEVVTRNKLTMDDVKLIKSEKHSTYGHPKYYALLVDDQRQISENEPETDPKLGFREDRTILKSENIAFNKFYNIAKNILERCNNPKNRNFRLYGGLGIKCNIGRSIRQVIESLEKVPGYKPGLFIDRTEPLANFSLVHPIHGEDIWIDDDGYQCIGTLRWVKQADQQVRNVVNEENKLTLDSLARFPRKYNSLISTIKRNFDLTDFVLVTVDNRKMSHLNEVLYVAVRKDSIKDFDFSKI